MHRQLGDLGGGEGDLSEIWFTTGKSWTHIRADTTLEGSRRESGAGAGAFAPETSCIWAAMACHDLHCISPVVRSGLPLQPPPVVRSLFARCSFGMGDAGSGEGGSFLLFPDTSTRIA